MVFLKERAAAPLAAELEWIHGNNKVRRNGGLESSIICRVKTIMKLVLGLVHKGEQIVSELRRTRFFRVLGEVVENSAVVEVASLVAVVGVWISIS